MVFNKKKRFVDLQHYILFELHFLSVSLLDQYLFCIYFSKFHWRYGRIVAEYRICSVQFIELPPTKWLQCASVASFKQ